MSCQGLVFDRPGAAEDPFLDVLRRASDGILQSSDAAGEQRHKILTDRACAAKKEKIIRDGHLQQNLISKPGSFVCTNS